MNTNQENQTNLLPAQLPKSEEPLNSWKEIGAYLQRNEATARRWEKEEGLPIHRHSHRRRASVYAFPSELDAWREGRKPDAEPEPERIALWGSPLSSFATATLLLLALITVGDGSPEALLVRGQAVSGPTSRVVWSGTTSEVDFQGTISDDGRYLSYTDFSAEENLALRDLVTGTSRLLTRDAKGDSYTESSAISHDGTQVAYAFFNSASGYELRVVPADHDPDQPARRLYVNEDINWIHVYDWSPDGQWIAVQMSREDGTSLLGMVAASDGSLSILKSAGWAGFSGAQLSPDGRFLAYSMQVDQKTKQSDLFVISADGSQENTVVQHPSNDALVDWTPDGRKLLLTSDRSGTPGLWEIEIEDGKAVGKPHLLRANFKGSYMTASGVLLSPQMLGGRNVQVGHFDSEKGTWVDPPKNPLPTFVGRNSYPQWSPDGSKIAYRRGRYVSVFSSDTGQVLEFKLDQMAQVGFFAQWSPDGERIVFEGADVKGRSGIYELDLLRGDVLPLTQGKEIPILMANPHWSPDGTRLYYWRNGEVPVFVEWDPTTRKERVLFEMEGMGFAQVSPDGKWVAVRTSEADGTKNTLWAVSMETGEKRLLMEEVHRWAFPGWTPDSASVIVFGADLGTWQAYLSGREPRKLAMHLGQGPVSFHPDGQQMAYWFSEEPSMELWTLENFLPEMVQ